MILPLEIHSCYSMLAGTAWPRQLVARAVEYSMHALALTDSDGLYGVLPFYTAARDAGVKPIIGARLGPLLILARDYEGYTHLCEIVTSVQLGKVMPAQIDLWPFSFGTEHIFLITSDSGLLNRLLKRGLTPLMGITHYGDTRSRRHAEKMIHTAHQMGIRPVAVHPVYFLDRSDYSMHRILCAIRENMAEAALQHSVASPEAWFCPPTHIEKLYSAWPEALDTIAWIEEECNVDLPLGKPIFPDFPVPDGETAFSWLWKQVFDGLRRRYHPVTPPVFDRAHYEMNIIHDLGFAPYFLIVADIVNFARNYNIPVVGRGSAANSIVAYALGITRVDPLKYNLYFERFLNRSRNDCPDIDLDLCWRGRDEVIAYVYKRYGTDRTAMVCTINTFQARSAVRETAKALGFPECEIQPITRRIPHYGAENLRLLLKNIPECSHLTMDEEPLRSVIDISQSIAGLPRHLSIHAGGLIIAPEPLVRYMPLQRSSKDIIITQFDKDAVEQLGLVKMDLLGHRALSAIHDTVASIRLHRNSEFDIESIPDADPATAALLQAGATIGCFQIESPAMRGLLRKLKADTCNTVIQAIALVRPGASGSGMKQHFIDRRQGRETVDYIHPAMETALGDTYGIMIYQEDVLKVAHAVAGMSLEEADGLRCAMSKKRGPREMARHMKQFIEGALKKGVPESQAQEIWRLVANFAEYAYCKAHAATYGELAYQCAWLKAHYPVEFFTAILANGGGFYSRPIYSNEAIRNGISILPPDINRSTENYKQEGSAIRTGLGQITGLTEKTIQNVIQERQKARFQSIKELLERVPLSISERESLCHAGALDSLPTVEGLPLLTRPVLLWFLRSYRTDHNSRLLTIEPILELPMAPNISLRARLCRESQFLGLPLSAHPLYNQMVTCWNKPFVHGHTMAHYEGREVIMMGIIIAERRLALHNGTGIMKFITIEDAWGVFEAVLFPDIYQRYGYLTELGAVREYHGTIQQEQGDIMLIINTIKPLEKSNCSIA